jgi:hypothetical protein
LKATTATPPIVPSSGRRWTRARQAVRSTAQKAGDIKTPVVGVPDPVKIGSWKIEL